MVNQAIRQYKTITVLQDEDLRTSKQQQSMLHLQWQATVNFKSQRIIRPNIFYIPCSVCSILDGKLNTMTLNFSTAELNRKEQNLFTFYRSYIIQQSRCGTCHIINPMQYNYINSVTTIMQEYYIIITHDRIM
jgi:nitrate/TMAO reductase-like tetraheme cytochrome c subunit